MKKFFLENHWARITHIFMKAFWDSADLSLYKLWSPRVKLGTQEGELFLHLYIGKNLLKWNIRPISIKLGTNISCMIGIQIYSNEGSCPLQRGDNHKNRVGSFKNLLLQNHWARRAHIYMKAFWYNVDSSLYKPWSPGVGRGHNRENYIYICLYWTNLLLQNQQANFNQTWHKSSLGKGNSKLYKSRARSFSKGR